jgi:hypothetical protein
VPTSTPHLPVTQRRRSAVTVAAAAGLVVVVLGGLPAIAVLRSSGGYGTATTATARSRSGSVPGAAGGPMLTVRSVTGAAVRVPDGKPTVLFFFTGECGTCYTGAKNLATVLDDTGSRADVVAVELDPSEPAAVLNQFLAAVGNPPFTVVRDDGTLLRRFRVDALGTTVVLDATGRETFRGVDPPPQEIRRALTAAGVA